MTAVRTRAEEIRDKDWRFAELVMRASVEPGLTDRYRENPVATLAEFGILVHGEDEAPELRTESPNESCIRVEDLDHPGEQIAAFPSFR